MISKSGKLIGHHEAADYIPFETMLRVVHELFRDRQYVMSVFISVASFTGLRVGDIKNLTWEQLLSTEPFTIVEEKTDKKRQVKINSNLQQQIIKPSYEALKIASPKARFLMSQKKCVFSTQRLNIKLKEIKTKYKMKDVPHISCHSCRKTFGRKFYQTQCELGKGNEALCMLMEMFNHSSQAITLRYLGIRQEELLSSYDVLEFN